MRSAGFSTPGIFSTINLPSDTSFCNQRSLISKCLILPRPQTKLLAALLSVPSFTTLCKSPKPNSSARLIKPLALVTPSTIA
eukprot:3802065-Karenia_brevis.AAC.1